MMKPRYTLLFLLLCPILLNAQEAWPILDKITQKLQLVKDYSVEAKIVSEIPLIRILPVHATIYYQQPEKFSIKAKGIAIIPRQGFTDILKLLKRKSDFNALVTGNEVINQHKTTIITLLPTNDTADIILLKMWVDEQRDLIYKLQATTRSNGTVTTEYVYQSQLALGLPDYLLFTVDVKKFKIPKGVATDINKSTKTVETNGNNGKGKIEVILTNYQVNKGFGVKGFKQKP